MRALAYSLVAGAAFWIGVAHTESRKPVQPYRIVRPDTAPLTPALLPICANLVEIRRACIASKRSALIQQVNPNMKGKM